MKSGLKKMKDMFFRGYRRVGISAKEAKKGGAPKYASYEWSIGMNLRFLLFLAVSLQKLYQVFLWNLSKEFGSSLPPHSLSNGLEYFF